MAISPGGPNNPPRGSNCFCLGVFLTEKGRLSMSDKASGRRGYRGCLVLCLLILVGLAGSMAWLVWPAKFSGPPVPDPNGYDTLLAAGRLVKGAPPAQGVADKATDEELRGFVASNDKALTAANAGFSQESVVPLGRMKSMEAHLEELGPFRQLGRVLSCRAVLARREERTSDALEASLDLLRLSHAVSNGGLVVGHLTGKAIQSQGIDVLEGPLLPQLSSQDARRVIAELERLGRDREPVSKVADRDLDFSLSRQGLQMRAAYVVNRKTLDSLRAPGIKAVETAERLSQGRTRTLLVKLALHAYALDHPENPKPGDLQTLVPSYLAEVPLTPGNERRLTLDDLEPKP
jgi:hypothetical protein